MGSNTVPQALYKALKLNTPEDFDRWYCSVERICQIGKYNDHLSPPRTMEAGPAEVYKTRDYELSSQVMNSLTSVDFRLVKRKQWFYQQIEALKIKYESSTANSKISLFSKLFQMEESSNAEDTIVEVEELKQRLDSHNIVLPQDLYTYLAALKIKNIVPSIHEQITTGVLKFDSYENFSNVALERAREVKFQMKPSQATSVALAVTESQRKNKTKIQCKFCRRYNHDISECRILKDKEKEQKEQQTNPKTGRQFERAAAIRDDQDNSDNELELGCMILCSVQTPSKFEWMVDSGASCHITPYKEILEDFQEMSQTVITASGIVTVKGFGTYRGITKINGKKTKLNMDKVYWIPGASMNLFSVSHFPKNVTTSITGDITKIHPENQPEKPFIIAEKKDHNWYFMIEPADQKAMSVHSDLGHPGRNFERAAQRNMDNVPKEAITENCDICTQAKAQHCSHKRKIQRNLQHILPGQAFHADIGGYQKSSHIGNKYFVIFKCKASNFRKIYFIKDRQHILQVFQKLINQVSAETGNKVSYLHTDSGTEFTSNKFKEFAEEQGITLTTSEVNTGQQNGFVERDIKTISERARCLLIDAKMDKGFWDEAVSHAVYLLNRQANSDKTPYEIYSGTRPDYKDLIKFGEEIFAKSNNPKTQQKFESKTIECRFLGFQHHGNTQKRCLLADDKVQIFSTVFKKAENKASKVQEQDEDAENFSDMKDEDQYQNAEYLSDTENITDESDWDSERIQVEANSTPKAKKQRKVYKANPERLETLRSAKNYHPETIMATVLPKSYKAAMASEETAEWKMAMDKEMNSLQKLGVYSIVDRDPSIKAIPMKWVLVKKQTVDGIVFKARVVALGCKQETENCHYSPVAAQSTIRLMISYCVRHKLSMKQFDVATAFLNGTIIGNVHVLQAQGYEDGTDRVYKLHKSLYGLKDSPKTWFNHITEIFLAGFNNRSTKALYDAAIKMGTYAYYTRKKGIVYTQDSKLIEFSDSSFTATRSQIGFLTSIGGVVDWQSHKATIMSLSTNEAEIDAIADGYKSVVRTSNILSEIGDKLEGIPLIYSDSKGGASTLTNGNLGQCLRHIERSRLAVLEASRKGIIEIKWIGTDYQMADALTKALPEAKILRLMNFLNENSGE